MPVVIDKSKCIAANLATKKSSRRSSLANCLAATSSAWTQIRQLLQPFEYRPVPWRPPLGAPWEILASTVVVKITSEQARQSLFAFLVGGGRLVGWGFVVDHVARTDRLFLPSWSKVADAVRNEFFAPFTSRGQIDFSAWEDAGVACGTVVLLLRRPSDSTLAVAMNKEARTGARRYERIVLPKGMEVAWYGGGQQQVSRVKTLGMGGVFLCGPITQPVGATLMVVFQVPGGMIQADAVVRNVVPGEGMGVEFVKMNEENRGLLEQLLKRLLRHDANRT